MTIVKAAHVGRPRACSWRCIGAKSTAIKRESRTRLTKYAIAHAPARMITIPATPTIGRRIDRPEPGTSVIDICHPVLLLRGYAQRIYCGHELNDRAATLAQLCGSARYPDTPRRQRALQGGGLLVEA